MREFAFVELESDPFDEDYAEPAEGRYVDREWAEIEDAAAEGRWDEIGIDSEPLVFEPAAIEDLMADG